MQVTVLAGSAECDLCHNTKTNGVELFKKGKRNETSTDVVICGDCLTKIQNAVACNHIGPVRRL